MRTRGFEPPRPLRTPGPQGSENQFTCHMDSTQVMFWQRFVTASRLCCIAGKLLLDWQFCPRFVRDSAREKSQLDTFVAKSDRRFRRRFLFALLSMPLKSVAFFSIISSKAAVDGTPSG